MHRPTMRAAAAAAVLLLSITVAACASPAVKAGFSGAEGYPKQVGEAQGGAYGVPGNYELLVCGGFYNFPAVTKDCYARTFSRTGAESTWRYISQMPKPLTHCATTAIADTMYFCGGFNDAHPGESVSDCFSFNRVSGNWSTLPSLPGDRAGGGLVNLNGTKLLYAGGVDRPERKNTGLVDYGSAWELDLADQESGWAERASMPSPRNHMGSAAVECGADGGRRYFWVGGQQVENEPAGNQPTVNEYVLSKGAWEPRADMPTPTGHISSSVVGYGCGFFLVGGVHNGGTESNEVWYYSAADDTWDQTVNLPQGAKTPVCGLRDNALVCAVGANTYKASFEL
jgi:N-acetylneuraminic acid mutarotase